MNRTTELVGGYWDGRAIQVPDDEPKEILMPLVDTGLQLLTYERQLNGKYTIKGPHDA